MWALVVDRNWKWARKLDLQNSTLVISIETCFFFACHLFAHALEMKLVALARNRFASGTRASYKTPTPIKTRAHTSPISRTRAWTRIDVNGGTRHSRVSAFTNATCPSAGSSRRHFHTSPTLNFDVDTVVPAVEMEHHYTIALGSNMGDRFENIERACEEMERRGIRITATSPLYESKAMYVEDQANFLNGTCTVCSRLHSPPVSEF